MRNILLSADGELSVYNVPDIVAANLEQYCYTFCSEWLRASPDAEKYRTDSGVLSYGERDFIEYLNTWLFKDEPSELVETLRGVYIPDSSDVPERYASCNWFNF